MGYKSIAYPTDETNLPQWFKELPFDEVEMETAVLDKKIQNVLGQMGWDLTRTKESEAFGEFFEFQSKKSVRFYLTDLNINVY